MSKTQVSEESRATPTKRAFLTPGLQAIKSDDQVVVVGLGVSGLSAALFCRGKGAQVTVSEIRQMEELDASHLKLLKEKGIEIEAGGHTSRLFLGADLLLVSPGVPLDSPILVEARESGVVVTGEMSLAGPYLNTPLVAVTGTNGKTTVTTLLGDIFRAAGRRVFVGGNIGTPLTDYLAGPQEADVVVLELSSFQLDSAIGFRPDVALLLNITADHLDRYDSFKEYLVSKFSIFQNQQGRDVSILNIDDRQIGNFLESRASLRCGWEERNALFFGKMLVEENGAVLRGKQVELVRDGVEGDGEIFELAATNLSVAPNLENGMAAILAAQAMGCAPEAIRLGLKNFSPLIHRLAFVAEVAGVRYFDDSKATNIGAVDAALAAMKGRLVLIAGGRGKNGGYSPLKESIRQKVKALLLIGEARFEMAEVFRNDTNVEMLDSLKQAVRRAHELASPGEVVLLSPACASFDMFGSYAERGEHFCRCVRGLEGEGRSCP